MMRTDIYEKVSLYKMNDLKPNFNEAEEYQNLNAVEPQIEKVITPKKRHKEQIKVVKQREIIYDLNEDQKTCSDCHSTLVEGGI